MSFPRAASILVAATALLLASPQAASAAIFVVNETGDQADAANDDQCDHDTGTGGLQCTLRAALDEADNNLLTADEIDFNLTGGTTISPVTALPAARNVTIDGFSQPGASPGTPVVELNGSSCSGCSGLSLNDEAVVKGLVINRFPGSGISTIGLADARVEGNFIGTDVTGTADLGNGGHGVTASPVAGVTVIGGTTAAERNIISGNGLNGVSLETGDRAEGNYIGTDKTGEEDLGNSGSGVFIINGGGNSVGGTAAGARNVISGNQVNGVLIDEPTDNTNSVQGNYIGTDKDGNEDLGNSQAGVRVDAPDQTIGGTAGGAGNVISGNGDDGVEIRADGDQAKVQGNLIGTDAGVTALLGNANGGISAPFGASTVTAGGTSPGAGNVVAANSSGIVLSQGSSHAVEGNVVALNDFDGVEFNGSATGRVGGQAAGAPNLIALNGSVGVRAGQTSPTNEQVAILSNSIFSNALLGIDLAPFGVTPNDPGDVDASPNDLQNFPVLTAAVTGGSTTEIDGSLNSLPNKTYRVEFFSNDACDPSDHGEGQTFLGARNVTIGPSGTKSFSRTIAMAIDPSDVVTATATDPDGNTSEFSACEDVEPRPSLSINDVELNEGDEGTRNAVFTVTLSSASPQRVRVDFDTANGTATASSDYQATSGTLTFQPAELTQKIRVPVNGDTLDEVTETFRVVLSNPDNATFADRRGTGRIKNDDN